MSTSPLQSSPLVRKGLDIYLENKKKRNYLKWGTINAVILSVMMYDIKNKCPFAYSKWYYIEYMIAGLLGLSVFYYFIKYLFLWFTFEPIKGTQAQRNLLHFGDGGNVNITFSVGLKTIHLKIFGFFLPYLNRFIIHCAATRES